jgi:hypothetical protein
MHQKKCFLNLFSLSNRPQIALCLFRERSASRLQRAFTTQIDKGGNKGWRQKVMVEHVTSTLAARRAKSRSFMSPAISPLRSCGEASGLKRREITLRIHVSGSRSLPRARAAYQP